MVLLAKTKLNTNQVLISKALIDSNLVIINFFSVNNMLIEYNDIKEAINVLR